MPRSNCNHTPNRLMCWREPHCCSSVQDFKLQCSEKHWLCVAQHWNNTRAQGNRSILHANTACSEIHPTHTGLNSHSLTNTCINKTSDRGIKPGCLPSIFLLSSSWKLTPCTEEACPQDTHGIKRRKESRKMWFVSFPTRFMYFFSLVQTTLVFSLSHTDKAQPDCARATRYCRRVPLKPRPHLLTYTTSVQWKAVKVFHL